MTPTPRQTSVSPTAGADDLVAPVPGLEQVADVQAATLRTVPGASLTFDDLLRGLVWARGAVESGATGVVLAPRARDAGRSAAWWRVGWSCRARSFARRRCKSPTASARKARLLLWALLALGYDDRAIREEFRRRGATART